MIELEAKDVKALRIIPPSQSAYLWFLGSRSIPDAFLKIYVIEFEESDFKTNRLVMSADYFGRSVITVPNTRRALDPSRLPSIDELLNVYICSRENRQPITGPFANLQKAIESFVVRYCSRPAELPLVRIHSIHSW